MSAPDEPQVTPLAEEPPPNPFGQHGQRYDGDIDPAPIIRINNAKRQYDQAGIEYPATLEDVDPSVSLPPHLNQLDPASAPVNGDDLVLNLIGNYFTADSVIVFNGGDEATICENPTLLTTIVKPSLVSMPISVPVFVRTGTHETKAYQFTFVEPMPVEPEPELPHAEQLPVFPEEPEVLLAPEELMPEEDIEDVSERSLPHGPFQINRITDHEDGIAVFVLEGDIREDDTVLIEATGNSSINGTYIVISAGLSIVVDNNYSLPEPIEGKGRLTVVE